LLFLLIRGKQNVPEYEDGEFEEEEEHENDEGEML
jgi:hypothetical protein